MAIVTCVNCGKQFERSGDYDEYMAKLNCKAIDLCDDCYQALYLNEERLGELCEEAIFSI
ncbi:MAG: hypothetical protein SVY53_12060 [Chloroflexota bacterium]|nr:hypothetical protein [Chloroflexota bacterium]